MCAEQLIRALPGATSVCLDRNGRGESYRRLFYRAAEGRWHGLYLGKVSPDDELILGLQTRRDLGRCILSARQQRRLARRVVGVIVKQNGCRLHGGRLHRKTGYGIKY